MDANDDLRESITYRWLTETVGLHNCIHEKHATSTQLYNITYIETSYDEEDQNIKHNSFMTINV